MANFTVSLKKLTEKVSMDVVYAPQDLENISVQVAEVNRPGLFWRATTIILISFGCRSWVWPR